MVHLYGILIQRSAVFFTCALFAPGISQSVVQELLHIVSLTNLWNGREKNPLLFGGRGFQWMIEMLSKLEQVYFMMDSQRVIPI